MILPRALVLLCSHILLAIAAPTRKLHRIQSKNQQQLAPFAATKPKAISSHLDAAPDSVALLFTTTDSDEVEHAWLPLGKRIYTRDAPALPLHPVTARITTMIRSTPQKAAPEVLDRVVCDIHPKYNRTMDNQNPEAMSISISRNDGLVRLEDADVKAWREIEWYECS